MAMMENGLSKQDRLSQSKALIMRRRGIKGVIICRIHEGSSLFEQGRLTEAKLVAEELLPLARKMED